MSNAAKEVERLRGFRVRPQRDLSIGPIIARTAESARRTDRRLGSFIDLWEEIVPGDLVVRTRVSALRRGVAHVTVESSAVAFELDRLLRGGVEATLRARYPATLTRVRIVVEQAPARRADIGRS